MSLGALWIAVLAGPALAQDDGFDLDTVFVAPVQTPDPDRAGQAAALTDRITAALREADHLVLVPDDVQAFGRDADLPARDYLAACPDGRYIECAFVVAQRAQADHAVVPILQDDGALSLSLMDVSGARVRLALDTDPIETDVPAQVVGLLAAVIADGADLVDVRIEPDVEVDPDAFAPAAAQAAAEEELASLDADPLARSDRREGRAARVSRSDMARYRGRDDAPPWDDAGLSADSWRRWRNSGRPLPWWKARAQGRQAELLLSITPIILGGGPWVQRYEAWYSVDPVSLQRSDTYVLQDQERGLLRAWELSIGFGILPWLDVAAFGGPSLHTMRWRIQRIVPGEDDPYDPIQELTVTGWRVGGRVNVAPFPTWPARPTLGLGAAAWWGEDRARVLAVPDDIPDLPRSRMVLLGIHPGVEADLGPVLRVFARMDIEVPVAARLSQTFESGGANLPEDRPGVSTSDDGISLAGTVGITARIRMAGRRWKGTSGR